jgi:glycosyltransferase involved in cell wall biosynthesis
MFDRIPLDPRSPAAPYSGLKGLEGILTVSQDGADLLRAAIPDVRVAIARNVIDEGVFHPDGGTDVRRSISYVPSRRAAELRQLLHLLNARPEISSGKWRLQALQGLSEQSMAVALRDSGIFLSLSDRDGFGLPPAEAMACGSYVVGYPGGGGKEFFEPAYCSPAHDTTEVFMALIEAMQWPEAVRRDLGAKASARILGHYTQEGLKADLLTFYGGLL